MRILITFCFCCLLSFTMSSCVTTSATSSATTNKTSALPASFTTENILKVHQGMSSDEILKLFGKPKSVNSSICGGLRGKSWQCTTWKYGKFPNDNASFTFSGTHGSYKLNDFDINRD